MKLPIIVVLVIAIIAGAFIATRNKEAEPTNEQPSAINEQSPPQSETPNTSAPATNPTLVLNGTKITGNYYQYTLADYNAARAAGRPIFLFFYANWCPTCAKQEPIVKQLMSEIADQSKLDDFVAFRVNYNDNETDADEKRIAEEFGVRYQHTMFVVTGDGQTAKKFLGQTDAATLKAAFSAVAQQ